MTYQEAKDFTYKTRVKQQAEQIERLNREIAKLKAQIKCK